MNAPYRYAVKRRTIKLLMDGHQYTRTQARVAWSHVTDDHIHQASMKCGVNPVTFDPSSILQWIKDNWQTILKVAMSLLPIILMFVQPKEPTKTKVAPEG